MGQYGCTELNKREECRKDGNTQQGLKGAERRIAVRGWSLRRP